jgi:hypothetical protein
MNRHELGPIQGYGSKDYASDQEEVGNGRESRIIFVGLRGEISVADLCRSTRHVFKKYANWCDRFVLVF